MGICLINPPQTQLKNPTAYIPLGLAYIAAKHPDCTVVNWASGIVESELPDTSTFGITCQTATYQSTREVISTIRTLRPKAHIVVGGALPSSAPYLASKLEADEVYSGFYADIRDYLPDRSKFNRNHLIDLTGVHGSLKPSTHMMASVGCPYSCKFCEKRHSMYRQYIYRTPEHILQEWDQLWKDYGIQHIRFSDDCFTANKKHTLELCEALTTRPQTYICITRTDRVDSEIFKALADSGCVQIDFGIESGSQRILDLMGKEVTVEQNLKSIQLAHEHGIKVKAFLMMNYPSETDTDRESTIQFVKDAKPEFFQLASYTSNDYFYLDNDTQWINFRSRIEQCISTPTEKN